MSDSKISSSFNAVFETDQGIPVHLSAEWNTANNFGITFFVDDKRIVLKPLETTAIFKGFDVLEPTQENPVRQYNPKKINEYFCKGKFKPGFYEQAEYFIKQIDSHEYHENQKASSLKNAFKTTLFIENLLSN